MTRPARAADTEFTLQPVDVEPICGLTDRRTGISVHEGKRARVCSNIDTKALATAQRRQYTTTAWGLSAERLKRPKRSCCRRGVC